MPGSFFPRLLRGRITLRMSLVWRQLAPTVAMQHVVRGGQRHRASQHFLQGRLDLTDDQYAALGRLVEEGFQQFGFLRWGCQNFCV